MGNYAYLRVSRDTQDVAAQRLGLLDYAHKNNYFPFEEIEETVSRAIPWRSRELGTLFEKVVTGDVILTSEFSRLGSSPAQVLGFLGVVGDILTGMGEGRTVVPLGLFHHILIAIGTACLEFLGAFSDISLVKAPNQEGGRPRCG